MCFFTIDNKATISHTDTSLHGGTHVAILISKHVHNKLTGNEYFKGNGLVCVGGCSGNAFIRSVMDDTISRGESKVGCRGVDL